MSKFSLFKPNYAQIIAIIILISVTLITFGCNENSNPTGNIIKGEPSDSNISLIQPDQGYDFDLISEDEIEIGTLI